MKLPHRGAYPVIGLAIFLSFSAAAERITHHFPALKNPAEDVRGAIGPAALEGSQTLRMHFIDVGQGDCILIEAPNGKVLLVDCGSNTFYKGAPVDTYRQAAHSVRDYIHEALKNDAPQIETLVISHPDTDHYDLLPYVLGGSRVARVLASGPRSEHAAKTLTPAGDLNSNALAQWVKQDCGNHWTRLGSAQASAPGLDGFGKMAVVVLAANVEKEGESKNARSIVLKLSYGDFDCILEGDGEGSTERAVLASTKSADRLDCEVLKVAHHGANTRGSSGAKWLDAVSPEVAILSAGYDAMHGHPSEKAVARLAEKTLPAPPHKLRVWSNKDTHNDLEGCEEALYSTATNGTICISTDGHAYNVAFDSAPPHPWRE